MTIVTVGGGWAGCAAALGAAKAGVRSVLLERTDQLLGTGLVGGIMRNNGRFAAAEELIAMGGGALFSLADENARHTNISFPGHVHASLYGVIRMPALVQRLLEEAGVEIYFCARVTAAQMDGTRIISVSTQDGQTLSGDQFIDATGTAGPMANCTKYGNGCAMCVLRCPSFGGRVSLTALAGVQELCAEHAGAPSGAMSGSCKLLKESLSPELAKRLDREGVAIVSIPAEMAADRLALKACQQYALPQFKNSLILLDTGGIKLMSPYFGLRCLHMLPGFENARYIDPCAGGRGNSMRFFAMAVRDDAMHVTGVENLFCAGEKAGLFVGHTEAIVTGTLAGYNAALAACGQEPRVYPRGLAVGEAIAWTREQMAQPKGLEKRHTFSGASLLEHLRECGLDSDDRDTIQKRVRLAGAQDLFAHI